MYQSSSRPTSTTRVVEMMATMHEVDQFDTRSVRTYHFFLGETSTLCFPRLICYNRLSLLQTHNCQRIIQDNCKKQVAPKSGAGLYKVYVGSLGIVAPIFELVSGDSGLLTLSKKCRPPGCPGGQ